MRLKEVVAAVESAYRRLVIGMDPTHEDWYEGMANDACDELRNAVDDLDAALDKEQP